MRFLKTLQLWDTGLIEAIKSGQLKLQVGQWVQCGQGEKSRYISHTKHTINLVHFQGDSSKTNELFKLKLKVRKIQKTA